MKQNIKATAFKQYKDKVKSKSYHTIIKHINAKQPFRGTFSKQSIYYTKKKKSEFNG